MSVRSMASSTYPGNKLYLYLCIDGSLEKVDIPLVIGLYIFEWKVVHRLAVGLNPGH